MEEFFIKILRWRENNISEKHFVIFLSFIVGLICALAAHALKFLIEILHELVNSHFAEGNLNYLYLATPIMGVALASLYVKYFVKDDISHGVTKIMFAISQKKARIKSHNMWSSSQFLDYRFWWVGWSRGPNRLDRFCYRIQFGTVI